jgi:hypothetical protein
LDSALPSCASDCELFSVVAAIWHFRYMLEGRSFVIFTNHKSLVGALGRRSILRQHASNVSCLSSLNFLSAFVTFVTANNPESEGDETAGSAAASLHNPVQRFSHLHIHLVGHSLHPAAATPISSRLGSLHQMGGSYAASLCFSGQLCHCPVQRLGGAVWGFTADHVRWVSQFCSSVWDPFTQWLGIKMRLTTPYHPQSNGTVQQFHRRLQDALWARLPKPDWVKHLPWVMLSLRATPKEDSGVSTAELVCSAPLSLPGQVLSIT